MRWEDERWVKVYTRDTGEWLALGWEAQALFLFALRKADRAGILKTGKMRTRGLAGMTGMPLDVVEQAVPLLLEDGCLRETDGGYIIPNFLAAQEAQTSASQRKRDQRERDRDQALANGMPTATSGMVIDSMAKMSRQDVTTDGHGLSSREHVTAGGHTGMVTPRVDESRVDETRKDLPPPSSAARQDSLLPESKPTPRRKKPKPEKPPDPRHAPLTRELCEELGWPHHGGRTGGVISRLLALADQRPATAGEAAPGEVVRRAALAKAYEGFPRVRELHELEDRWGHFETAPARGQGPPRQDPNAGIARPDPEACAACGDGDTADYGGTRLCYGSPVFGSAPGCAQLWQDAVEVGGWKPEDVAEWARKRRAA